MKVASSEVSSTPQLSDISPRIQFFSVLTLPSWGQFLLNVASLGIANYSKGNKRPLAHTREYSCPPLEVSPKNKEDPSKPLIPLD